VVSALAHGGDPHHRQVLDALVSALQTVGPDHSEIYSDVVRASLPEAARVYLERLMSIPKIKSRQELEPLFRDHYQAEGEAKALLTVLTTRGIDIPDDARDRITTCTDLDQLDSWLRRAVTANAIDEVFAG
jgi:hypothetical protein